MKQDTQIIAICGIDGTGKSTIVNELERRSLIPGASYVRLEKKLPSNRSVINKYGSRLYNDGRDWLEGSYAESIGIGLAFDFLEHYETNIEPLLGNVPYIVSDRYFPCFVSYLESIYSTFSANELFNGTRDPDIVFFVYIQEETLVLRHQSRGGKQEDEDPVVMSRFNRAYRDFFERSSLRVKYVDNGGKLDKTLDFLIDELRLMD
jgi:thymidylate kinase